MAQKAAALKQPAVEAPQEAEPRVEQVGEAPQGQEAEKVVGLHGPFVAPDPAGPNIDLFDNVPV